MPGRGGCDEGGGGGGEVVPAPGPQPVGGAGGEDGGGEEGPGVPLLTLSSGVRMFRVLNLHISLAEENVLQYTVF